MKISLVIIFVILSIPLFPQSKKVKIKLVQYLPYCGGARPTPEIEAKQKIATLYSNKKLIFVSENKKIDTLFTDKNGYLKSKLSFGTYLVFESWKYYKKIPLGMLESNINMECLYEEWVKEDLKIVVSKKPISIINNLLHPQCPYKFPCLIKKHLPQ